MNKRIVDLLAFGLLLLGLAGNTSATPDFTDGSDGLSDFSGCTELKRYLVRTAKQQAWLQTQGASVSPAFEGGDGVIMPSPPVAEVGGNISISLDHSDTNVQEKGVDESDLVKTDGNYIYLLNSSYLLVVDSWPAASMSEVSRLQIEGSPLGLLLVGDLAMVISNVWEQSVEPMDMVNLIYPPYLSSRTKVTLVDVADRAAPKAVREVYLEGMYNTVRLINGRAHLVVTNVLPIYQSPVVSYLPGVAGMNQGSPAIEEIKAFGRTLMEKDLLDLVPKREDRRMLASGEAQVDVGPISPCDDFYRPDIPNGSNTVSVVTLDLNDPQANLHSVTVVSDNGEVYAAADSLYITALNSGVWYWLAPEGAEQESSVIHKFTLGAEPEYVASGKVPGWIVNRYAMSEYEGAFRIATTTNMWGWNGGTPQNRLFVLTQNENRLDVTATLDGLGHEGERIYAVRYDGDRGYLVTFRQTDPLYTLDLSDPAAPKVAGELEIPGFSTYLHPIADGYLLAIGQNTDKGGADLSLFDVRDPTAPAMVDREWLGEGSWSEAMYEPHAFTYFAPLKQLALPLQQWYYPVVMADGSVAEEPVGFNGTVVFDVDMELGLVKRGTVDHSGFTDPWSWTSSVQRNLYIGGDEGYALYSLSQAALKASDADTLEDISSIELPGMDIWYVPIVDVVEPAEVQ